MRGTTVGQTIMCNLCEFTGVAQMWSKDKNIARCPHCGHVFFTGPVPLDRLYERDYFHRGEYFDYISDQAIIALNLKKRLDTVRRFIQTGRLLEIGCAHGFFLEQAEKYFEAHGVDVSSCAINYAKKHGRMVQCEDFLTLPDQHETYDCICLWDTLEHLPFPKETVLKISRWMKKGGYLFITTGDVGSLVPRVRKDSWRLVHPPTHIHYFSKQTLRRLINVCAHLDIQSIKTVGMHRNLRSMLGQLCQQALRDRKWLARLIELPYLDIPLYLNFQDIVMVVARKPLLNESYTT